MPGGDDKRKHLDLIAAAINRLAGNAFLIKGWSVTLVSALLGLAVKEGNAGLAWLGLGPALLFWGLDGHFLQLEREMRNVHQRVAALPEAEVDYSLTLGREGNPSRAAEDRFLDAVFSPSILVFHLGLCALCVGSAWLCP